MAQKITTNQLKRIINNVLNENIYFPVDGETHEKFKEVCKNILYPHGSSTPLTKEQFMETLTDLGEANYNGMTGDHLSENKTRIRRKY